MPPEFWNGITPAYAGTTIISFGCFPPVRDHPRLRGNHNRKWLWPWIWWGSPPLTREPRLNAGKTANTSRITPAYAGTTFCSCNACIAGVDHPRLRGNHPLRDVLPLPCLGSPPLTREPRFKKPVLFPKLGITPAYAGTTSCWDPVKCTQQDHPRLRGNHCYPDGHFLHFLGSPPLTREPRNER